MSPRLILAAAVLVLAASPVMAQQQSNQRQSAPQQSVQQQTVGQMPCGDRGSLLSQLKEKYKESQTGAGLTDNGAVVELMTSDNGSWTLILSMPNGQSCLIGTGDGWEQAKGKLAKSEKDV